MTVLHVLIFAWSWVTLGLLSGTVIGLFFHRLGWLGGFDAWPRRMVRLGHIAFLGTGLLNLMFIATVRAVSPLAELSESPWLAWTAAAWVAGALSMPTVCFLSAWRKPMRHAFFIPVLSLLGGAAGTLAWLVQALR